MIDPEEALLGCILVNSTVYPMVMEMVRESHFVHTQPRTVWRAISDMGSRGEHIDLVTVWAWLVENKKADLVTKDWFTSLVEKVPSSANTEYYARLVATRGGLAEVSDTVLATVAKIHGDPLSALSSIESTIAGLYAKMPGKKPQSIADHAAVSFQALESGKRMGLSTGFADLDETLGGLRKGEVLIVAGRPSMGKTSFANAIAINVAQQGVPVLYFSLESPGRQVALNAICAQGRVCASDMLRGRAGEADYARLVATAGEVAPLKIFIHDDPRLTPERMVGKSKAFHTGEQLGLVILDYIQLCRADDRHGNREQEVASVSRALKTMAMSLNVPVLALSQLNRRVDGDSDKRPKLSDLRESGSIEQDADVVMLLYRDEYYDPQSTKKGICEVNVAKHRNGPVGCVELGFTAKYMRFDNLRHDTTR